MHAPTLCSRNLPIARLKSLGAAMRRMGGLLLPLIGLNAGAAPSSPLDVPAYLAADAPASISSITAPTDGSYRAGASLTFTVNYTADITITGTPRLALTIGSATVYATYDADNSDATALAFTYTVQAGNTDTNGIAVVSPLQLNDGSIAATSDSSAALLTFTAPNTSGILVDTTAPTTPIAPNLDPASDSGTASSDRITKITAPTFTGTAESGSTVKLFDGGTIEIGSGTATGGSWRITSTELSEGSHSISISATDAAGNTSSVSGTTSLTIDTTAPEITGPTNFYLPVGATSIDSLQATGDPRSFAADANFPAGLSVNATNGSFIGSPTTEGTTTFTATIGDLAGNTITGPFTFTIAPVDSVAPTIVSITLENSPQPDAQEIAYKVVFSERVINVNMTDFNIDLISGFAAGLITRVEPNADSSEFTVYASLFGDIYGKHSSQLRLALADSLVDIKDLSHHALDLSNRPAAPTFSSSLTHPETTGTLHQFYYPEDVPSEAPFKLNTGSLALLFPGLTSRYGKTQPMRMDIVIDGFTPNQALFSDNLNNLNYTATFYVQEFNGSYTKAVTVSGVIELRNGLHHEDDTEVFGYNVATLHFASMAVDFTAVGTVNTSSALFKLNLTGSGWIVALNAGSLSRLTYPISPVRLNEVKYKDDGSDTIDFIEFYDGGLGNTTTSGVELTGDLSLSDPDLQPMDIVTNSAGYFILGSSNTPNVSNTGLDSSQVTGSGITVTYGNPDNFGLRIQIETLAGLHPSALNQTFSRQRVPQESPILSDSSQFDLGFPTPGAPNTIFLNDNTFSIVENATTTFDLDAFGGDPDDIEAGVTYSISGGADAALFAVNATTGVLGFKASPDYETPADTNTDNSYVVEVTAHRAPPFNDARATPFTITVTDVDDTAPDAPSMPDLIDEDDSGASATDNLTNDATPTFTGTAETGATVKLFDTDGTTLLGSATATDGTWQITSSALADGSHILTATATDVAGNISAASTGLTLAVDTAPPNITSLATNSLTYGSSIVYTITATGSATSFSGSDLGSQITVNATTGALSGTPTAAGTTTGTIAATDTAGNTTTIDLTITVNRRTLTLSGLLAQNKTYDGSAPASLNPTAAQLIGIVGADSVSLNLSSARATFANAAAGAHQVEVTGLTLSGTHAGNYTLTEPFTTSGTINPKTLTVTNVATKTKVYDGSVDATLETTDATLSGLIAGDVVELDASGVNATYADADASTDIVVTVTGLALSGTDSGNYTLTQPAITGDISPKALTISDLAVENKAYDGDNEATLDATEATLTGVVAEDNIALSLADANARFANANAGTGKAITVTGATVTGTDAGNYTLTQPTGITADITRKPLTVTGITAENRTYDATTDVTVEGSGATLVGVVGDDTVSPNVANLAGAFTTKSAGTAKTVNLTGITLTGDDATNYSVTQPTTTASISAATVTVTGITAENKAYDGNTDATLNLTGATVEAVISRDTITLDTTNVVGAFADTAKGENKAVTITALALAGADKDNYTIASATTSADITAKALTVTGVTAAPKTYDANTDATLDTTTAALVGVVDNEDVTLAVDTATGTFADAAAETDKTVTIAGLTLSGDDVDNYTLTQPIATATITAKVLTLSGITASNKVYDATTDASVQGTSVTLVGVINDDDVSPDITALRGTFADKAVGAGKTVSVTGITLTGTAAGNYAATEPTTTADITAKGLAVTGVTAANKTYDGTTNAIINTSSALLSGVAVDDVVSLETTSASGSFANQNVGTAKTVAITGLTLSGTDAPNYTLTQPTTTATISAQTLTVTSVTASNKTYDANTIATVHGSGATLVGIIGSDNVTPDVTAIAGTFGNKQVGSGKPVTITGLNLSGTDAANYTVTQPTTTATIRPATVSVSGITAAPKAYDATTAATLILTGATLADVISGDRVSLDTTAATGTFADAAKGEDKIVNITGLTLTGTDRANYTITALTATADITAKVLTVAGITAANKTYDATADATLDTNEAALVGVDEDDEVRLDVSAAAGAFSDADVGTNKTVTVSGLTLGGTDADNYALTQPTTSASITAKDVTITGLLPESKTYDGTTDVMIDGADATLVGLIDGDDVSLDQSTGTAVFADALVATGKAITIGGATLTGDDAANYALTFPTDLTADITAKSLTVSGLTVSGKVYDGSNTASFDAGSATLVGLVSGDDVGLDSTGASAVFASSAMGSAQTISVTGLVLTGSDAANYSLTAPSGLQATITARPLSVTGITADSKTYDGGTTISLDTSSATLVGTVLGDDVGLVVTAAAGAVETAAIGTAKPVTVTGLTLSGTTAGNYTLTAPTGLTTAIVTKSLSVSGISVLDKTYDGTTTASLDTSAAKLVGIVDDDQVTLNTSSVSARFSSATVAADKAITVSGLQITGAASGNYTLVTPTDLTATITDKALSLSGITVANKTYDGTTTVSFETSAAALVGVVVGDTVSFDATDATGAFDTAAVGTAKPVSVSGLTLTGADAGNYSLNQPTGLTADVTARKLTVSGILITSKVYDGTTTAHADVSAAALANKVEGDDVALDVSGLTAVYGTAAVGTGKTVTLSGLALAGSTRPNYTLTQPTGTGDITAASLTVTADDQSRRQSASNPTLTYTVTGFVNGEAPSVAFTGIPALATEATPTSPVGTYTITITSGSLSSGNYVFSFVEGMLEVTPPHHAADTDQDWTLSLLELTRVIDLYNTRDGTVRTGAYRSQAETEDGYTPGTGTIERYHSADTDQDGTLSLLELTRVIDLYNTRSGTTRTGTYHNADDTEDGYAPGPAPAP